MSSYDDFLRESKVFDEFHTLPPSEKLKWRELYEDSKKTLAPPVPKEMIVDIFTEALGQFVKKQNNTDDNTIHISTVSKTKVSDFLKRKSIPVVDDDVAITSNESVQFDVFSWTSENSEEMDTPRACIHLNSQLAKFGINFEKFSLHDIHLDKSAFSIDDSKWAKITGGADAVIVPSRTSTENLTAQVNVVFKFKTTYNINNPKTNYKIFPQACAELISARYLSNQPSVIVIATDLSTRAMGYRFSHSPSGNGYIIIKSQFQNLSHMAAYVKYHLGHYGRGADFIPSEDSAVPEEAAIKRFKLEHTSLYSKDEYDEQFEEMIEETKPWSRERAEIVQQISYYHELPMSASVRFAMYG